MEIFERKSVEILKRKSVEIFERKSVEIFERKSVEIFERKSVEIFKRKSVEIFKRKSPCLHLVLVVSVFGLCNERFYRDYTQGEQTLDNDGVGRVSVARRAVVDAAPQFEHADLHGARVPRSPQWHHGVHLHRVAQDDASRRHRRGGRQEATDRRSVALRAHGELQFGRSDLQGTPPGGRREPRPDTAAVAARQRVTVRRPPDGIPVLPACEGRGPQERRVGRVQQDVLDPELPQFVPGAAEGQGVPGSLQPSGSQREHTAGQPEATVRE